MCACAALLFCVCTCGGQCLISCIILKSFSTCIFCCWWWWFLFLMWGLLLTLQLVILAIVPEQRAPVSLMSLFSSTRLTEHPDAHSFSMDTGSRNPNSGSHVCVWSTFPAEHLPRPRWRTAGVKDWKNLGFPSPVLKFFTAFLLRQMETYLLRRHKKIHLILLVTLLPSNPPAMKTAPPGLHLPTFYDGYMHVSMVRAKMNTWHT